MRSPPPYCKAAHPTVLAFKKNDRVAVPNQDVLLELTYLNEVVPMDLRIWRNIPEPCRPGVWDTQLSRAGLIIGRAGTHRNRICL